MVNIYFETYGCPLNFADTQTMVSKLKEADFKIINVPEKADVIIVNSCTVKLPTAHKILRHLKEFKLLKKPIVLAGCLPQSETNLESLSDYSLIGVTQTNNIVTVVEEALNGNIVVLLGREDFSRNVIPHTRRNNIIEIIPISQGCLGNCTYCKVKLARGDLFSYEPRAIMKTIEEAVSTGAKEIWLTSQDVGSYGLDIGWNLPKLLDLLVTIKGDFKIRVGMANPEHILQFLEPLIESFKDEKIFKFLHVPVQAGNNDTLKKMGRRYTVDDFKKIIAGFRNEIKDITIATDIITGFPSENIKQFNDSLRLVEEIKPNIINISRFWPMDGTVAAKMKGYSGNVTKARSRKLTKLFHQVAFQENLKWINWKGTVFIEEKGKLGSWVGRNFAYKPVIILSNELSIGDVVNVKVVDVTSFDLRAKVV